MAADGMMEQADVHVLGTNTAASMATQHDLDVIYKDLSGYPTVSATYNGGVAAIGDQAFVLAVNPDTTPILAAARYGKGKVVVAGDDSYFKFTSDITDERKTVARNILLWLTEDSGDADLSGGLGRQGAIAHAVGNVEKLCDRD